MFTPLVLLASLVSLVASVSAKPYLTSPVQGSTCSGGSTCNINWQDDNNTPSLTDFGDAKVGLYVGNVNQQTLLQLVTDSVNVATTAAISFTVDPNVGPDDSIYFMRFDSNNGKNGSAPYQSFSAKFTLNNMSGTFNSTVQAQINAVDGVSSTAAVTTTGASPASSASGLTKVSSASSSKASGSSTASGSASSSTANAAGRVNVAGSIVGAAGAAAALFALAF